MQYEVAFGTDIAHRPTYLEISSVSSSENFGKYFSLQVAPQGDVSSEEALQYLFESICVCVVYIVAIFYIFSKIISRLFFFICCLDPVFSVTLRSNLHFVFHSMHKR